MTEARLPQELEEQAALHALGLLDSDDRRAFEVRLSGESLPLRQAAAAYQAVTEALASAVRQTKPRASLRERVLAHIAQQVEPSVDLSSTFTFLRTSDIEWQEVSPGTFVKMLHNDTVHQRATVLCRMEPGSVYGSHRHAQMEELYVLEGTCHCGGRLMHPGDYHRAEAGSIHPPTSTETGSVMLVISSTQKGPLP
jgi:quercetin dioxygenase-like cupin family protein